MNIVILASVNHRVPFHVETVTVSSEKIIDHAILYKMLEIELQQYLMIDTFNVSFCKKGHDFNMQVKSRKLLQRRAQI